MTDQLVIECPSCGTRTAFDRCHECSREHRDDGLIPFRQRRIHTMIGHSIAPEAELTAKQVTIQRPRIRSIEAKEIKRATRHIHKKRSL